MSSYSTPDELIVDSHPTPQEGHPVLLTGPTVLQAGDEIPANHAQLINHPPFPSEISEIRFGLSTLGQSVSGGMVQAKMQLGELPITKDFVPLSGFCRSNQLYFSEQAFEGSDCVAAGLGQMVAAADYVWRMKTPIIIPSGGTIGLILKHTGYIPEEIQVQVSYLGRTLPTSYPTEFNLPFIANWSMPAVDMTFQTDGTPSTTTVENISTQDDLANNIDNVVYVDELVGRIFQNMAPVEGGNATLTESTLLEDAMPAIDRLVFLSLRTSTGHDIIRPETQLPFRGVFGGSTRSLDCKCTLPPRHYLIADVVVTKGVNGGGGNTPLLPTQLMVQISMIGYRKVSL